MAMNFKHKIVRVAADVVRGHGSLAKSSVCLAFVLAAVGALSAAIPTPEQFFGFKIGTDKKLARYDRIVEYFQAIAANSDRVRVHNVGPTTSGNPFLLVEISSADNLKNLDHLKDLERKLYFQGGQPSDAEREEIFRAGKSVVLITNNVHSTEIGSSQMVVELVHQLATEDSARVKNILDKVVFLLVPSLNPDGQILVTDWYNKNVDTPFEASPLPKLWHPYVGHDDNRDEYLFSQKESKLIAQVLWHDWFPSIWLDEHQQGSSGPRIFTMPATDPINPNVDPLIYRLNTIYGQQQAAALEAEGKTGIIYNSTYTNFWPGAMAWTGWWHNEVGLLTEVASAKIATPLIQEKADPSKPAQPATPPGADAFEAERRRMFEHPEAPLPPPKDITARTEYPRPWLGGKWTLRDIVDYELIATYALLDAAANSRETLLHEIYDINLHTVEAGAAGTIGSGKENAYAALIPISTQHDPKEAEELVDKLQIAGVEVYRASKDFQQDGRKYNAGTFVVPFNQVFGRYAKDLLERQTYPEVRRSPQAPPEPPYDVSAWSLGLQFGVETPYAKTPLNKGAALVKLEAKPPLTLAYRKTPNSWVFPYDGANSAIIVNRLLNSGAAVSITKSSVDGISFVSAKTKPDVWSKATTGFELTTPAGTDVVAERAQVFGTAIRQPRIAIYQSWTANMDEGWTRWVLDHYEFTYTVLHNADVKAGKLHDRFDGIILPDQRPKEILEGLDYKSILPEYRGGIGDDGWKAIHDFVSHGGTLISLGDASDLLIDKLPLPIKDIKRTTTREQHFAPGTIVNLQVDPASPIGGGVAPSTYGFYINSPFFQLTDGFSSQKVSVVARYPNQDVRASGWLRGEELMRGHAAVVAIDLNPGKIVLFGIRPQHRAQTHATLPLLFNALYWSSEGDLTSSVQ